MNLPEIATRNEWLAARKALLAKEKELTRARDALAADRRRLPMVRIDKEYVFQGPDGPATLHDLFDGRHQLIVDHAMWSFDVDEHGVETPRDVACPSCSGRLDNIGNLAHLRARDTNLVVVSRAPFAKIEPFRRRMAWTFPWYSSANSDFNHDFHATVDERVRPVLLNYRDVDELAAHGFEWTPARRGDYPGLSAFLRVGDDVFHTYSTFARGSELVGGVYGFLDVTPKGRNEPPGGNLTSWVRYHDKYEEKSGDSCCHGAPGSV